MAYCSIPTGPVEPKSYLKFILENTAGISAKHYQPNIIAVNIVRLAMATDL